MDARTHRSRGRGSRSRTSSTLEFPDPGRRWRILCVALLILLGMGGTAVVMKKLAHVGDLREEMDFRKNQGKQ